jgi:GAF domain-containing protein
MANYSDTSAAPKQFSLSFDTAMALETTAFPFTCVLSLEPLITHWQQCAASDHPGMVGLARGMQEELVQAPELLGPIEDLTVIARHQRLVDRLMSLVFPLAFWERDYGAACQPYQLRSFYATPSFARLLMAPDGTFGHGMQADSSTLAGVSILSGYVDILRKFYGINIDFEFPLILTRCDPTTGLERSFQMRFNKQFLDIHQRGGPTTLSSTAQRHLLAHLPDLEVWMDVLPPEHFVFRGFTIVTAVDVTAQTVLSSLRHDVVEKVSLGAETTSLDLQDKIRTLLSRPDIVVALLAIQNQQVFMLNQTFSDAQRYQACAYELSSCFAHGTPYHQDKLAGSLLNQVITQGHLLVIEDLAVFPAPTALEEAFLLQGIRNLLVMPLYYQHDLLGVLALGSPHPGDLHALTSVQLREVVPLLAMAVKRSLEELNHRIEAFIKEQYTAIHPAVEWRFRQVALHVLQQHSAAREAEPIVFPDVYPLYAISDIRGSSTQRNEAIQADLLEHLALAEAVVCQAYAWRPLPALDELRYRIHGYSEQIGASLNAGDEEMVLDFLRQQVEPLFDHLQEFDPGMRTCIEAYRATLDPQLGMIYRRRRDFEASVTRINEILAAYLDAEEAVAQQMCPHYFELHTTDGVEHGIYVGASLMEDGTFDPLYLRNLRLWQLLVMCGAVLLTAQLREQLMLPLETTHLVLAHHTPLSIRFHPEEKQFAVDGAYNMRYQIMKKRLDKSLIHGTTERLTQPGKIAIVYSQPREAQEYLQYIDYLRAKGFVTSEVEDMDLEDVPGAYGLKALRITVNMQAELPRQGAMPTSSEHDGSSLVLQSVPAPALGTPARVP